MINIKLWDSDLTDKNDKLVRLLKKSFNVNKIYELNLVKKKTYIISLLANNTLIGTISLIPNNDLINYLKTKGQYIESLSGIYSFRADKGIYIYNLAVIKDFRGKGIAQKLLDIAMYVAKTKEFNYCHTHCENDISEHIFRKRGYNLENTFQNEKKQTIKLMTSWL